MFALSQKQIFVMQQSMSFRALKGVTFIIPRPARGFSTASVLLPPVTLRRQNVKAFDLLRHVNDGWGKPGLHRSLA
jgi:hypothetical protein